MRPWIRASPPAHPTKSFMFPNRSLSEAPRFQQQQTSICLPNSWDMMTVVSQPRKDSFSFFPPFILHFNYFLLLMTSNSYTPHVFSLHMFLCFFCVCSSPKLFLLLLLFHFSHPSLPTMLCQCMTLQLEKTKEQRGRFSLPSMRWNYGWLLPTTARCERGSQSCEVDTAFPATGHTRSPESRTDLVKMGVGEQHPVMPSWTWTHPWWRLSYYESLYLLSGEFRQFNISMKWRGLLITECNQENDFGVVSAAVWQQQLAGAGWCLLVLCSDGWDGRQLNQTHNFTVLKMYPRSEAVIVIKTS